MAESASHGKLINPCFFHLQKLELELKCPMWYVLAVNFIPSSYISTIQSLQGIDPELWVKHL